MPDRQRCVVDTNVLVSRLLVKQSTPAQALRLLLNSSQLIVSAETFFELDAVLNRPKFDRYLSASDRSHFLAELQRVALMISNVVPLIACRDPKDDKFLALACAGRANLILSGDEDLLALHPFRGIKILSPRQYLINETKLTDRRD